MAVEVQGSPGMLEMSFVSDGRLILYRQGWFSKFSTIDIRDKRGVGLIASIA